MRLDHIFLLSFLSSLVVQGFYWQTFDTLDQSRWITATQSLMTLSPEMFDPFTYGYPGAPPMALAIGVHKIFDVPLPQAYTGSIAVIIALAAATAAWLCKLIRPHLLWWLTSLITLSSQTLYHEATPPSAIVMPLITLVLLASFYIYENHRRAYQRWPFVMLGVVVGLAAAARLDVAVFIALIQAVLLWFVVGWSAILFTTLVALGTFFIVNPFMWFFPFHHISSFVEKLFHHYADWDAGNFYLNRFIRKSSFAWLGILYGFTFLLWPQARSFVPRWIILNLFLVTGLMGLILFSATYRPIWYFSPLIVLWEIFFMLFVLELTSRIQYGGLLLRFKRFLPGEAVQFFIVVAFILARLGLLVLLVRFPAFFIV